MLMSCNHVTVSPVLITCLGFWHATPRSRHHIVMPRCHPDATALSKHHGTPKLCHSSTVLNARPGFSHWSNHATCSYDSAVYLGSELSFVNLNIWKMIGQSHLPIPISHTRRFVVDHKQTLITWLTATDLNWLLIDQNWPKLAANWPQLAVNRPQLAVNRPELAVNRPQLDISVKMA